MYIRGATAAAVQEAVAKEEPRAAISSRAAVVAELRASPLVDSALRGFRAAIVLAAIDRALVQAAKLSPATIGQIGEPGQLARTDLDGHVELLAAARAIYADADISYDQAWVASPTTRVGGESGKSGSDFGLTLIPLEGGAPKFIPLGAGSSEHAFVESAVALPP